MSSHMLIINNEEEQVIKTDMSSYLKGIETVLDLTLDYCVVPFFS